MTSFSAIYRGDVIHRRHRPKVHRLHYRVFSLLVDLDELPVLGRRLKLFGHNRFSLFSVHDRDHGKLALGDLKSWALEELSNAGIDEAVARVEMLCYPRILGYVFNPLTVYFCYRADGTLVAILYEVCNTFKERMTYVIPVVDDTRPVRQTAEKQLYVSPFIPMECEYHFSIAPPGGTVSVRINEKDSEGPCCLLPSTEDVTSSATGLFSPPFCLSVDDVKNHCGHSPGSGTVTDEGNTGIQTPAIRIAHSKRGRGRQAAKRQAR
nr:DUF1365 domain-containing protein [Marinicella sp. W31]MDC2877061.1 DUF1365 domain-containing protein [Marinicella sp. W31]